VNLPVSVLSNDTGNGTAAGTSDSGSGGSSRHQRRIADLGEPARLGQRAGLGSQYRHG
jgi:hypothetical protein